MQCGGGHGVSWVDPSLAPTQLRPPQAWFLGAPFLPPLQVGVEWAPRLGSTVLRCKDTLGKEEGMRWVSPPSGAPPPASRWPSSAHHSHAPAAPCHVPGRVRNSDQCLTAKASHLLQGSPVTSHSGSPQRSSKSWWHVMGMFATTWKSGLHCLLYGTTKGTSLGDPFVMGWPLWLVPSILATSYSPLPSSGVRL